MVSGPGQRGKVRFPIINTSFPFTPLIIGCIFGLFIVLDPFFASLMANRIDLTIAGTNAFKLYPYELSTLVFLFVLVLPLIKKLVTRIAFNFEKSFLVLFLIGVQTRSLTTLGRIDLIELLLIIFLFVLLLNSIVKYEKFKVTVLDLLNLLFIFSVFLSAVIGGVGSFLSSLITMIKFLLIVFLIVNSIKNEDTLIFFLKWLVIVTTISSIIGIVQEAIFVRLGIPITGFFVDKDSMRFMFEETSFGTLMRVPAFFMTYKPLSFFLNTAMLIVFNYFIYKGPFDLKKRLILISSFLLMFIALLLTFSTDGLLSVCIGLILSVLIWRPNLIVHGFLLILIAMIAIYVFNFADDIQSALSAQIRWGEQRIRLQLAREGILGFVHRHPWVGVGIRNGDKYTGHFYGWPAHNAFILAADEIGVLGLFFYSALLCYTLSNLIKANLVVQEISDKWIPTSLLSGFIAFLITIQFHPFFIEKFTWMYMGVVQAYTLIVFRTGSRRLEGGERVRL